MNIFVFLFSLPGLILAQWNPQTYDDRQAIVHLFEWKWNDIADECENFLGPKGYGGVQVSNPIEHAAIYGTPGGDRPWWERYQPVSYIIQTRSGNEADFKDMVHRCNTANVRIYVDAIFNHMAKGYHGSTANSGYDSNGRYYPAVPYYGSDFNSALYNCPSWDGNIHNYNDPIEVRNCDLDSLPDLALGETNVRSKIIDYLNKFIDIGVAGFRIDAAKHTWPGDLQIIYNGLNSLKTTYFPAGTPPFMYHEVIDYGGEPITGDDYDEYGRVTEFKYGQKLGEVFLKYWDQRLAYLQNFGRDWGFLVSTSALVFIDNHDNQRGHGGGSYAIVTHTTSRLYKMMNAFMLAWPYGVARVMSSFNFAHPDQGPPQDAQNNILSPEIQPDDSCVYENWICEHRWRQIYNMVEFRNVVKGTPVTEWYDNGWHKIAFARDGKGFIAINNDIYDFYELLQTTLPPGTYCEIASGNISEDKDTCYGSEITVQSDGRAQVDIPTSAYDGFIAIHIDAKRND